MWTLSPLLPNSTGCIAPPSTVNVSTTLYKLKWVSLGCPAVCKHHNSPDHKRYTHSIKLSLGKVRNRRPSEIIGCQLPSGICQSWEGKKEAALIRSPNKKSTSTSCGSNWKNFFVFEALKISCPWGWLSLCSASRPLSHTKVIKLSLWLPKFPAHKNYRKLLLSSIST